MADKTIVRLKIMSNSKTPQEISDFVGLVCEKSWRIGDKVGRTLITMKDNVWMLSHGLPKSSPLEEQIEALLLLVSPFAHRIRSFEEHGDVELSCVIYAKSAPPLNFNKLIIQQIAALGATLDIDLYLGCEDEERA